MDTLGSRLKQLREETGFTLEYVANKLGTTKVSIGRYERDEREPKSDMLNLLASFYNVSVDYLLGRTDDSKPPVVVETEILNKKDNKRIDKIMENFENGLEGAVMLDGEIMDEHTKELFLQSVRSIYELVTKDNKKYTPNKYK